MTHTRRDFFKLAGLTGMGAMGSQFDIFALHEAKMQNSDLSKQIRDYSKYRNQSFNMSGYAAPAIPVVRMGVIGLGNRGLSNLGHFIQVDGLEVCALSDLRPESLKRASNILKDTKHKPKMYSSGDKEEWKKVCEDPDIDLIMVTTPWYMHTEMSIYAMECGKHVACAVPAVGTIDECWALVETSERTRKHFYMLENILFLEFQLMMVNMAHKGFFGDIVHGDCAYNTSKLGNNFSKTLYWNMWWLKEYAWRKGNFYSTHGLGPISSMMDINRGDRFDYLVSVESNDFTMGKHAVELAKKDDFYKPFVGKDYRGNMNTTTIRTKKGRTIVVQHDASSPSPHAFIHGLYGTKGAALYDPAPPRLSSGNHKWVDAKEFAELQKKYTPEITLRMNHITKNSGHGGADLLEAWRLIDCLRHGYALDQDVYDAASLSSIGPLSEWSVRNRSNSIDIPDFTAGSWETNKRNLDVNLERCGNTKILDNKFVTKLKL